jgi:hypothetical protein
MPTMIATTIASMTRTMTISKPPGGVMVSPWFAGCPTDETLVGTSADVLEPHGLRR